MPEHPTSSERLQQRIERIRDLARERDRREADKPGQMELSPPEEDAAQ